MTNIEHIKQMDEKELAELLVKETLQQDVDYDWDESPFAIYETVYETLSSVGQSIRLNAVRRARPKMQKQIWRVTENGYEPFLMALIIIEYDI